MLVKTSIQQQCCDPSYSSHHNNFSSLHFVFSWIYEFHIRSHLYAVCVIHDELKLGFCFCWMIPTMVNKQWHEDSDRVLPFPFHPSTYSNTEYRVYFLHLVSTTNIIRSSKLKSKCINFHLNEYPLNFAFQTSNMYVFEKCIPDKMGKGVGINQNLNSIDNRGVSKMFSASQCCHSILIQKHSNGEIECFLLPSNCS